MTAVTAEPVLFDTIPAGNYRIGVATLNRPERLNSLDFRMIQLLEAQLAEWKDADDIAMVVLQGAGEKAFCAGGDIRDMADAIRRSDYDRALEYFTAEYRLDYVIHHYPKPILAWCHGLALGGGLGLMQGASHRVVTDSVVMAMPEIAIGLFPDVGAAWFFQRMPGRLGLFCGLTGARLDARDAIACGLADYRIAADRHATVLGRLPSLTFGPDPAANHDALSRLLREFHRSVASSPLLQQAEAIQAVTDFREPLAVRNALTRAADRDPWFVPCEERVAAGSPTTFALVLEQFHRCRYMSLGEILQLDLVMALRCCRNNDFPEGVRALLIDKDKAPRWSPDSLVDVDPAVIETYFVAPWDGPNPLARLR